MKETSTIFGGNPHKPASVVRDNNEPERIELKASHGLITAVSVVAGNMIGSGIFVSPKGILMGTGSPGLSLAVWVLCGLLTIASGLCFIELGLMFPFSGGEYTYVHQTLGKGVGFLVMWVNYWAVKPSTLAILCSLTAQYILSPLFPDCGIPLPLERLLALFFLVTMVGINVYSVKLASKTQVVITSVKVASLVLISTVGLINLFTGNVGYWKNPFENSETRIGMIALGFYSGTWAFDGWQNLNYVTEEVKNPQRNLPAGMFGAVAIVMTVYLLVNVSYFTVLSPQELLDSPAVAVSWASYALPMVTWMFPIFVAISTLGTLNSSLMSSTRIFYTAARDGLAPSLLGMVHVKFFTPFPSLSAQLVVTVIMICTTGILEMINYISFVMWGVYALCMVGLFRMRYVKPDASRPYKVPLVFPIIVFIASIVLLLAPIIEEPRLEFVMASAFVAAGMLFYYPFVRWDWKVPGTGTFTVLCQCLMQVSPGASRES